MKIVLVNVPFRDVYTGEIYKAGKTYPMSEERVKEVKEVNPNFVTVIGNVPGEEPVEEGVEEGIEEVVEEPATETKKPKKK